MWILTSAEDSVCSYDTPSSMDLWTGGWLKPYDYATERQATPGSFVVDGPSVQPRAIPWTKKQNTLRDEEVFLLSIFPGATARDPLDE